MGIGGATARRLAEDGASVLIGDIEDEAAAANVRTIRQAGGTAETLHADVGTADGPRQMVERALELWGRLDFLVNNAYAGVFPGDAVTLSEADWDRSMDVGLKAMFRSAKHAVPHMRAAGGGAVVNVASVHGLLVAPGWLAYETLKHGVIGLTRQFAVEYGPTLSAGCVVSPASDKSWCVIGTVVTH
jgi:NAD(P)-dependent dehydrogenase (short-subunit alcohol dehydrogenase family)